MNPLIKNWLKQAGVYYPLQGFYSNAKASIKAFIIRTKYRKFRGEGYQCNFCGNSFSTFAPWYPKPVNVAALEKHNVIAGYGENIFCPACMSTARERLLKAIIASSIDISGKKVLHMSPEKKLYDYISQHAEVVTADYHPQFYKVIDPLVRFADAVSLPFDENMFDLVIGNHIMEHINDDITAMREIYRVLKPGGSAILQVPFSETIRQTIEEPGIADPARQSALFGQHDHVRIYALQDYLARLSNSGFIVHYCSYERLRNFYMYAVQKGEGFIDIRK